MLRSCNAKLLLIFVIKIKVVTLIYTKRIVIDAISLILNLLHIQRNLLMYSNIGNNTCLK